MKYITKTFFFFIILIPVTCFSQVTISGRVLNQADSKPVANASVFLSNSSVGAETANDGAFNLKNVKPGKYELIVSIIGFEKYNQTITVTNNNIPLTDILIFSKTILLHEVSIKSVTDADRKRYYDWFKEEFLGTSDLAGECKIVNPEMLAFDYDKKTDVLTASSTDFLIIENDALGYRLKYLLTNFSLDNSTSAKFHLNYEGSVLFEQMKGTLSQEKRWQKRRQEVYEGSLMHFLRSALVNRIDQEGFRAVLLKRYANPERPKDSVIDARIKFYKNMRSEGAGMRDSLSFWVKKDKLPKIIEKLITVPLSKDNVIKPTNQQGVFAFGPENNKDAFYITYNKHHHFSTNLRTYYLNDLNNNETTLVNFDAPHAFFDSNGAVFNPNSLAFNGVWGRNRVAELLPVDYEPPVNINNQSEPNGLNVTESAQPGPLKDDLIKLQASSDSLAGNHPLEKVYLQFDKPYYALGDTIWFKAYLLNSFLMASDRSRIININIANDSNKVIKQYRLAVQNGLSWGDISLDEKEFTAGTYTIRAYTNWMRNFGADYFFYKSFYISSANENNLLVNTRFNTSNINGNNVLTAKLLFSDINKKPFMVKPLTLQVMNGNKHLYKQKLQTGVDGTLVISFNIPQKLSNLVIIAGSEQKDKKAVIPINLNRAENVDLQFLPEGGNIVAGLPAHIAFKAISEDGKGVQVSGIVTDHNQKQVAEFKSLHNGMGSFDLAIQDGETYTAKVTLPGGTVKNYPLPAVKSTGLVLKVINPMESDSIAVSVAATNDIIQSADSYFLIGKARGIVCYAAIINFNKSNYIKREIAKSLFPTGITHFTLMTATHQPLNERLVFINHNDNLNIQIRPDKPSYRPRDSVALDLKVSDNEGNPVSGNFSFAVTDDAQVKTDTLKSENIITRMLLTSDLKGYVEAPGYYLSSKTSETWQALDNLLLTQGWIGYDWKQVFNPPAIAYQPEKELVVNGNVFNVFNKPVKGTDVLLFSKTPAILMDTLTGKDGKFIFDHFPRIDTPIFVLKAVNKNGKSFNVGINVDEVKPPDFIKPAGPLITPWYVNSDSTLLNYTKNNAIVKQRENFPAGGHILKEVKITGKKIIKDSQNLNGPGNADVVLDEKDLEAAGKKTFRQLFEQNIKGFEEKYHGTHSWFYIYTKPIILIVDGVRIDRLYNQFDFKQYIEFHNAEDIKGMEVISSTHNAANYISRFFPMEYLDKFAFIEITTRSGNPIISNTPGMYLYKPLPLSWPKQFYKPKYAVKDTVKHLPDLRSTIDWEPNITTGINGEAKLWFYTADKPSTYTIIVEGTDMNGNLGYKMGKIVVNRK